MGLCILSDFSVFFALPWGSARLVGHYKGAGRSLLGRLGVGGEDRHVDTAALVDGVGLEHKSHQAVDQGDQGLDLAFDVDHCLQWREQELQELQPKQESGEDAAEVAPHRGGWEHDGGDDQVEKRRRQDGDLDLGAAHDSGVLEAVDDGGSVALLVGDVRDEGEDDARQPDDVGVGAHHRAHQRVQQPRHHRHEVEGDAGVDSAVSALVEAQEWSQRHNVDEPVHDTSVEQQVEGQPVEVELEDGAGVQRELVRQVVARNQVEHKEREGEDGQAHGEGRVSLQRLEQHRRRGLETE